MSAIFGILRFDGGAVSAQDLNGMAAGIAHRSPDGSKVAIDGALGLGHGLMRITAEDRLDAQPLRDRDIHVRLVADLRLDNREELAQLLGVGSGELSSLADSALLLMAYREWGEGCADRLLGDFAFAIWDARTEKLILGRDHMGQRALLYYRGPDYFLFASEAAAFHSHKGVPRAPTDEQIDLLLRASTSRDDISDGIHAVAAGTVVTIRADGSTTRRRYWEPRADPMHEGRDEAYYIAAYRSVLGEAVACRLRRLTHPSGLLFSGGYDSAAIAGLAGPVLGNRKLIAAASVMPAGYQGDIRHARRWVEMCARDMPFLDVRYVTREGLSVLTGLEQAFLRNGGPVGPYHFVIRALFETLSAAGARLVMDGHGGDYTLHPRGQAALARFLARLQLRRFVAELRAHRRMTRVSFRETLKRDVIGPLVPHNVTALWKRIRRGSLSPWGDRPIAPALAKRLIVDGAIHLRELQIAARPELDMRGAMLKMLKRQMDSAAPAFAGPAARHGLELTRPFHDKRVVELALAIPQELYVKNGRNRYLACAALKEVYPPEFQTRWRKNDDEIPDFQRMAKSIEPQLLADIARMEKSGKLSDYVDFAKIRGLLAVRGPDDHNSGWEPETLLALQGYLVARYIEWVRRDNR